jgi:hypothetical protein
MSANDTRKLLGRSRSFGSRATIYQGEDALEIEINEQYDVVQKRVLYDDVLMVTIHREFGAAYLVVMGVIALIFLGIATLIVSLSFDAWPAAVIFAIFGLPALIAFLVRLFLRLDVVTVFGRRSKTNLGFALRKQRAREVYGKICAAVRNAQRQAGDDRGEQQADALDVSSPHT